MNSLTKTSNLIDAINRSLGRSISWLTLAMVVLMFFNVTSRYIFQTNLIWQQELVGFMHAVVFLAAAGYTLLDDKHVRVDVFYHGFSDKAKAIIDMCGTILFLMPVCFAISYFSYGFIISSWKILESSPEYNGMQGIFLLKSCIWAFAFSVAMQGLSTICKSINILRS